jgi:hypothetical protein
VARIETALKLKHTVDRRLGEFQALKDHVTQSTTTRRAGGLTMPPRGGRFL